MKKRRVKAKDIVAYANTIGEVIEYIREQRDKEINNLSPVGKIHASENIKRYSDEKIYQLGIIKDFLEGIEMKI